MALQTDAGRRVPLQSSGGYAPTTGLGGGRNCGLEGYAPCIDYQKDGTRSKVCFRVGARVMEDGNCHLFDAAADDGCGEVGAACCGNNANVFCKGAAAFGLTWCGYCDLGGECGASGTCASAP